MSAEDTITKKIGPLPAWAWAASVVVLVLVFRHLQGRNAEAPTDDGSDAALGTDLTAPGNDPVADPFAGGGYTGSTGGGDSGGGDTSNTDLADTLGGILEGITGVGETLTGIEDTLNSPPEGEHHHKPKRINRAQWGSGAADHLIGKGVAPSDADTAIWKYLHGKPLGPDERKLVNRAIRHTGQPPGGVIKVVEKPKPVGNKQDTHHDDGKKTAKEKPHKRKAA